MCMAASRLPRYPKVVDDAAHIVAMRSVSVARSRTGLLHIASDNGMYRDDVMP